MFLCFPWKQGLTFHANCCMKCQILFSEKIRKTSSICRLLNLPRQKWRLLHLNRPCTFGYVRPAWSVFAGRSRRNVFFLTLMLIHSRTMEAHFSRSPTQSSHDDICSVTLAHCSLETPKSVTGKQCRPRSDAAERGVWSGSSQIANASTIFL